MLNAKQFHNDLFAFLFNKGIPCTTLPTVFGKQLSLFDLYKAVKRVGGFEVCDERDLWDDVILEMGWLNDGDFSNKHFVNPSNLEILFKQIYCRYIWPYEQNLVPKAVPSMESVISERDSDDSDEGYRPPKEARLSQHSKPEQVKFIDDLQFHLAVPFNYKHRNNASDYVRRQHGLPPVNGRLIGWEYQSIIRSLLSGFPNEFHLALKTCFTVCVSADFILDTRRAPTVFDLFCSHLGVFPNEGLSWHELYTSWRASDSLDFAKFWTSTTGADHRHVLKDILAEICEVDLSDSVDSGVPADCGASTMQGTANEPPSHDEDEYFSESIQSSQEFKMVYAVVKFLSNVLFLDPNGRESFNLTFLSNRSAVVKLLALASGSSLPALRHTALDCLNVVLRYCPLQYYRSSVFLQTLGDCDDTVPLTQWLKPICAFKDRFLIIANLEILAVVAQNPANRTLLISSLAQHQTLLDEMFLKVRQIMLLPDIHMAISAVDFLFAVSALGSLSSYFAEKSRLLPTVIEYLTIETQSFGPQSTKYFRVLERRTNQPTQPTAVSSTPAVPAQHQQAQPQAALRQHSLYTTQPHNSPSPTMTTAGPVSATPVSSRQHKTLAPRPPLPHSPLVQRPVMTGTTPPAAPSSSNSGTPSPQPAKNSDGETPPAMTNGSIPPLAVNGRPMVNGGHVYTNGPMIAKDVPVKPKAPPQSPGKTTPVKSQSSEDQNSFWSVPESPETARVSEPVVSNGNGVGAEVDSPSSQPVAQPAPLSNGLPATSAVECEWDQCRFGCDDYMALSTHFVTTHYAAVLEEQPTVSNCRWQNCPNAGMVRGAVSLLSHCMAYHLVENPEPQPAGNLPSVLSAEQTVKNRFRFIHPQSFVHGQQGPVTRHFNLTAALVLRNLCRAACSNLTDPFGLMICKQLMGRYEEKLSQLAISTKDMAGAVASALYYAQRRIALEGEISSSVS